MTQSRHFRFGEHGEHLSKPNFLQKSHSRVCNQIRFGLRRLANHELIQSAMGQSNEEDKVAKDVGSVAVSRESSIPPSPYAQISRQIDEADLDSPAVKRILLSEVDTLQLRVSKLESTEKQYHIVDKECAVLREKIKALSSREVLYGFCLTVGSAIVGLSALVWSDGYGWVAILVGTSLVVGAVLSRVIKWR